jgi:hypothetical protein
LLRRSPAPHAGANLYIQRHAGGRGGCLHAAAAAARDTRSHRIDAAAAAGGGGAPAAPGY